MERPRTGSVWAVAAAAVVAAACATGGDDSGAGPWDAAEPSDGASLDGAFTTDGAATDRVSGSSSGADGASSSGSSGGSGGSGSSSGSTGNDGASGADAPADTSTKDASSDGGHHKDSAADAPAETGGCSGCTTGEACCAGTCTPTDTTSNCSACGVACDTTHSVGSSCNGTTCAYGGCTSGYADCVLAPPDADGCETAIDSNQADCGACGRACSTANVKAVSCSGGTCNSTCNAGWGNCTQPSAPGADDGCESDLTTCVGTPCCATGVCQGKHHDGLGDVYDDCTAFGIPGNAATYTATMAGEASKAWANPGGAAHFSTGHCTESGGAKDQCEANYSGGACAVWCFTGGLAGYVRENTAPGAGGTNCLCPINKGTSWD